jgi:hypothetical protein
MRSNGKIEQKGGKKMLKGIKRIKRKLKRWGFWISLCVSLPFSLLSFADPAFASIEAGGYALYLKVLAVGKWVIIIKGTIDIIQTILKGNYFEGKRIFLGYLLCYAAIAILPWALEEVEVIFK